MILFDARLINLNFETGISRYSKFILDELNTNFGVSNVIVLSNVEFDCKNELVLTRLKPFNIKDYLLFTFLCFKLKFKYKIKTYYTPFYSGVYLNVFSNYFITIHDLMFYNVNNLFSNNKLINSLAISYFHIIVSFSLTKYANIISVSECTFNDVKNIFGKNSLIIPETFFPIKKDLNDNKELSIKIPKNYILYVGNNRKNKNIDIVLNVFKKYNLDIDLVIVGHDGYSTSNITYLGKVCDSELNFVYNKANAFVFPSIYEGFGIPVLEAIYYDLPVICSDIPAFREFNSLNTHFFDPYSEKELLFLLQSISKLKFNLKDKRNILFKYSNINFKENLNKYVFKKIR